jgi:hypothetical protein
LGPSETRIEEILRHGTGLVCQKSLPRKINIKFEIRGNCRKQVLTREEAEFFFNC